jgi:hypothetical protein
MAFSFDFTIDSEEPKSINSVPVEEQTLDDEQEQEPALHDSIDTTNRIPFAWFPDEFVQTLLTQRSLDEIEYTQVYENLRKTATRYVAAATDTNETSIAPTESDDLIIPFQYEGGGAVWEGSMDLVHYLTTLQQQQDSVELLQPPPSSILELGCGHALPAIACVHQYPNATITLLDYNATVLQDVTISNLVLNSVVPTRMGAGDWMQVPTDNKWDWILAAETVYTEQAATETAMFLHRHLRNTAWIATKRYYFGVGGGTSAFVRACENLGGLHAQVVHVVDTGKGNVREILKVTRT